MNGRLPTTTNYDYSNENDIDSDFVRISSNLASGKTILILVQSMSEVKLISLSVFRDSKVAAELPLGIPLRYNLPSSNSVIFNLRIHSANLTQIVLSPISSLLSLRCIVTNSVSKKQWISDVNQTFPIVSVIPSLMEVKGYFTIQIQNNLDSNGNVINGDSAFLLSANIYGSKSYAVSVLEGYGIIDALNFDDQSFFVWSIPPFSTDVEVSLDVISGDPDLFINFCESGFYSHMSLLDMFYYDSWDFYDTAEWSSQHFTGRESISIPSIYTNVSHPKMLCITAYAYDDSLYVIRGVTFNSVLTIIEGLPYHGAVPYQRYRYFRFVDTKTNTDLQFDVFPTSGDADLYISCLSNPIGNDNGYPSRSVGHYNVSSAHNSEDAITISAHSKYSCVSKSSSLAVVYFVAVYGRSISSYTLEVQHYGGVVTLSSGIPLKGKVFKWKGAYYQFHVGSQAQELTISLTPYDGNCDLYVSISGGTAQYWHYDLRSAQTGSAVDKVIIPESEICTNCWISILVVGLEASRYSILASFIDTTVTLMDSIPMKSSVAQGQYQYYALKATTNGSVEVILTLLNGNTGSIYFSKVNPHPTKDSKNVSAKVEPVNGEFPYLLTDTITQNDFIYFGVTSDYNITYSIRASVLIMTYNSSLGTYPNLYSLFQGLPQLDVAMSLNWKFYRIVLPPGHEILSILASTLVGSINLNLQRCTLMYEIDCFRSGYFPSPTNYLLSTQGSPDNFLTYNRVDSNSTLYILGVSPLTNQSVFQVSYTTGSSVLALVLGTPIYDHVLRGEVDSFSFQIQDATHSQIRIALTPLNGDPNLYVSTIYSHPIPPHNYTWRSHDYGEDILVIDPNKDAEACSNCIYYISVYGSSEAMYTLTVSLESNIPRLLDGIPSVGHVDIWYWSYFTFTDPFGTAKDIYISVTSLSGNSDLYISLNGVIPTKSVYDYASKKYGTNDDTLLIKHNDEPFSNCLALSKLGCQIIIGIYGSKTSDFSITLTSLSAAQTLQHGLPKSDNVRNGTAKYYRTTIFTSQQANNTPIGLSITMQPSSGQIQGFMSCSSDHPNSENYQLKFTPAVGKYVYMIPNYALSEISCKSSGNMYIAVYGITVSTYTITINALDSNSSIPTLLPGVASSGNALYHYFDWYYVFPGSVYEDINIVATVYSGDVSLYVSKSMSEQAYYVPTSEGDGQMFSYLVASNTLGSEVLILNHDLISNNCLERSNCYFMLGVFGTASNADISSSYSITFSLADSTVTLSNGIPIRGVVNTNQYEYYSFNLNSRNADIIFILTSYSGDADCYVSIAPTIHPNTSNYLWSSGRYSRDIISIQSSELSTICWNNSATILLGYCSLYIAIRGYRNASYSIVANIDLGYSSPILLLDGQSQNGLVQEESYQYYDFKISNSSGILSSIVITLTPLDGHDSDIYASFSGQPGIHHYDYLSTNYGSTVDQITISPSDPKYCSGCTLHICVFGYYTSQYSITLSSARVSTLSTGTPVGGHIDKYQFQYFSIYNRDSLAVLTFYLTSIIGDADIYVSTETIDSIVINVPTINQYTWKATHSGSDTLTIKYSDPSFCVSCFYILGIYGFKNSTYNLLVTETQDQLITLFFNRPQNVYLASNSSSKQNDAIKYFCITPSNSVDDILLSITILSSGFADMFVNIYNASAKGNVASSIPVAMYPSPRDPSSYKFSTLNSQNEYLLIPGDKFYNSILIVAVIPRSPSISISYSIVASSTRSTIALQSGIPQYQYVATNQMAYFVYYPDAIGDISISLTAISGDPDLLASNIHPYPYCAMNNNQYSAYCGNFTWLSQSTFTDTIIISKDFPCKSMKQSIAINSNECDPNMILDDRNPLYIGIYGYKASTFNLLLSTSGQLQQLVSGQPLVAYTSLGYDCSQRNPSNGACISSSIHNTAVQVSYFSFHVLPSKDLTSQSISFSVNVPCDSTALSCIPGCPCNPLYMIIQSCVANSCSESDRYPSKWNGYYVSSTKLSPGTTTNFITSSDEIYCDPNHAQQDCIYYIAVMTYTNPSTPASFIITVQLSGQVTLVPCYSLTADGYRGILTDSKVLNTAQTYYELCSFNSTDMLVVSLEQCSGNPISVFVNSDDILSGNILPSSSNWQYYLDAKKSCSSSLSPGKCQSFSNDHNGEYKLPTLLLAERQSNYYLSTNGTGIYKLHVLSTIDNELKTPKIILNNSINSMSFIRLDDTTAQISWNLAKIILPDTNGKIIQADIMKYILYCVDTTAVMNSVSSSGSNFNFPVFNTPCGLAMALNNFPDHIISISVTPFSSEQSTITRKVTGIEKSIDYTVFLVAVCDSSCARQLSKYNGGGRCLESTVGCQSSYYVYDPMILADPVSTPLIKPYRGVLRKIIIGSFIFVVLIILVMIGLYVYWKKRTSYTRTDPDLPRNEFDMLMFLGLRKKKHEYKVTELVDSAIFRRTNPLDLSPRRTIDFSEDTSPSTYEPPSLESSITNPITSTASSIWSKASKIMKSQATSVYGKLSTNNEADEEVEISL